VQIETARAGVAPAQAGLDRATAEVEPSASPTHASEAPVMQLQPPYDELDRAVNQGRARSRRGGHSRLTGVRLGLRRGQLTSLGCSGRPAGDVVASLGSCDEGLERQRALLSRST
jgi:hypothetical protein